MPWISVTARRSCDSVCQPSKEAAGQEKTSPSLFDSDQALSRLDDWGFAGRFSAVSSLQI